MKFSKETSGVILVLVSASLMGFYPVLINRGVETIPPLTFAALITLSAAVCSFIFSWKSGVFHELRRRESYPALFMITLCIVVIPSILFFIGTQKTSGINTSMLELAEIIFMLLFTPFIGEPTTFYKLLGALGVFIGAVLLMYNGTFYPNWGDILIILSTALYPIGNFYSKKALNLISPAIILFVRWLLGGLVLFLVARWLEPNAALGRIMIDHWKTILFNGIIVFFAGKILWYEALKRLDITKAVSLVMTFPLFSLLILLGYYHEHISLFKWLGIIIMSIGIYFSVKRSSVPIEQTKYAPL